MEIKHTKGSSRIVTDNKDPDKLVKTESISKGISDIRDSFEAAKSDSPLSENLGMFAGPLIGTTIGNAIGDSVNHSDENAAAEKIRNSITTNDQSPEDTEKQKDLTNKEKQLRRQDNFFTHQPDDD